MVAQAIDTCHPYHVPVFPAYLARNQMARFTTHKVSQRHLVSYVPQRESVDWDFPVDALGVVAMGLYGRHLVSDSQTTSTRYCARVIFPNGMVQESHTSNRLLV